jgi:antitoxin (DNA-binding transcriptional repressor) of toxin-antitoxin stability system
VRELARSAGSLINQIEADGSVFAVSRHGRIVALLVPLPDRLVLEFDGPSSQSWADADPECDEVELSPLQRDILIDAASTPTGYWQIPESRDVHSALRAVGHLELAGLLDRTHGALRLTKAGRAVVKGLLRERGG